MTGIPWTDEETAVLLVFSMWGYKHEAIAEILTNRRAEIRGILHTNMPPSYTRTVSAIRNKLNELRTQNPRLWLKEEGWNRAAITEYLYDSMADLAHVNRLLNLNAADINIITRYDM
ncbi:uncharacterized protein N7446_006144 [Penicillium canescens]|uniref:Myb-like domain-containing protein n=1 Tax=Penicillium canescens TaxID=5083 RepID=A0AAD6IKY8_PENCN|nr:uncharacterized protein N7446_006144 [Penicillium canescens]KAJ6051511.1 hypothetical protein N7460_002045 [Penicillium canescens]KAJ6062024.1 hypothetical protein N7446_006144 [Penicillium canescens]KAJ6065274.1 hypothetical protein N7444_000927 [Penicillium canescens]